MLYYYLLKSFLQRIADQGIGSYLRMIGARPFGAMFGCAGVSKPIRSPGLLTPAGLRLGPHGLRYE